jgi:hypothetical protein
MRLCVPESQTAVGNVGRGVVVGRALRVGNSVTKCASLAPVIVRRFCNGPLISQHFHRPVTREIVGRSRHDFKWLHGGIMRLRIFQAGAPT